MALRSQSGLGVTLQSGTKGGGALNSRFDLDRFFGKS